MDANAIIPSLFGSPRALIGVIHVPALPGTPASDRSVRAIAEAAVLEARIYADAGFHGIMMENTHDRPYLKERVGPEVTAAMAVVGSADLGQTFGRTGVINPPRSDLGAFDSTPFIMGVTYGKVRFDYRGRHQELLRNITPGDVRWICELLNRLTDAQWQEAFRAGGYDPALATRFIHRMKEKIAEGLALTG